MKKVIIIVSILVAVVVAGATIATILLQPEEVKLSGTYSEEALGTGRTLTFDGEKVVAMYRAAGEEVYTLNGEYEITDGSITLTFENDRPDNIFAGTFSFEIGDGYIVFDGIKFPKVE